MTSFRLPSKGRLNREKLISFTFDGKTYFGYEGDTIASALMANDVSVVGRSFKYHRPRGIMAAGAEEANAIAQLGTPPFEEPNVRMTTTAIQEGLTLKSVNCWPNAKYDLLAVTGILKRFFVAGFYYKVFKWPGWKFWSPMVRQMAGLGTIPKENDPSAYDHQYKHVDVLVVGAGPAGIRAALEHAKEDKQVLLVEQDHQIGGALLFEDAQIFNLSALKWIDAQKEKLQSHPNVTVMTRSTAVGYYDDNLLAVSERLTDHIDVNKVADTPREKLWHIRAQKVVLATGAIERPLVFSNNDLPGIMLASAIRTYVNRYEVSPGHKVVIATNNDDAYRTALCLQKAGVKVVALVDARQSPDGYLVHAVEDAGIEILKGHVVTEAKGQKRLSSVTVSPIDLSENVLSTMRFNLKCDLLGMSGGYSPVVHLHSQSGGKLRFDDCKLAFVPSLYVQDNECIGAANGYFELSDILSDVEPIHNSPIEALWDLPTEREDIRHAKRWVDFQHDVTSSDVNLAARENYTSVEHFKRYTTTGMAMDQGKTSNINALAILGQVTNRDIPEVGTTKFRPPYTPVTMGAFAGRKRGKLFKPIRYLALNSWHEAYDAVFDEYGIWTRPAYYKEDNETAQAAIEREVLHVRHAVGILDYSPLGKIDVRGKDAAEFLHKFYINNVKAMKVGVARYGLMLNEQATVMEDGVFSRLEEDHFWLTTTSGNAAMIAGWLDEWRQCEWPYLDVIVTPMTTGWGTISIQGPKSRKLLETLGLDIDFANEAFPHMTVRCTTLGSVEIRILRTSFTGELGYEVSMPSSYMRSMWEALLERGKELKVEPFGVEALLVMRTEKGYVHVGGDTDSATIPHDIGFGAMADRKKDDFIGQRSLTREAALQKNREQLVGLEVIGDKVLPVGGIIMANGYSAPPAPIEGRVTSSVYSPTLKKPVALGLVLNGYERMGEVINIYDFEGSYEAKITSTCFYDTKGELVHG
ncbi:sarcosine oxidase subunit alpha family protein [Curvivirga aplysinae]|uniref:sarcosine oxidase subunit alpha family protein n=1 Tax=Curvivirga aplysinae TaxID=2529852 RepID=UPI0012BC969E|nr:sarcosine oxidase subunit alpha family protein [Curvivirga aplysinae]MTI08384.1 sarcosine oxidase subunit alpha family protein [Curvivirga aplysinae]